MTRRRAAFTLLEILAVLVIMGLVAGLVLPGLGATAGRVLDDQVQTLAADLEFARQRAVMTGIPHRLLLDLDAGTWRLEWQPAPEDLPPEPPPDERAAPSARPALSLAPPPRAERVFQPLPAQFARSASLQEGVFFDGVATPEGVFGEGRVAVVFQADGSADPSEIALAEPRGAKVVVEIQPLADAVRVRDVAL